MSIRFNLETLSTTDFKIRHGYNELEHLDHH